MFRGKLIENQEYYKLRRTVMIVGFLAAMGIGLFSGSIFSLPAHPSGFIILIAVIGIIIYVTLIAYQYQLNKGIWIFAGRRTIEINLDTIYIKSGDGKIVQEIELEKIQKILVKKSYQMPEGTVKELLREAIRDYTKNYIVVESVASAQRYDFTIESYYMVEQLKKVIENWRTNGYHVETIKDHS